MPLLPEQQARERIDAMLIAAGWAVQSRDAVNLRAARGVAVREFHLLPGHGIADYLLFVDGKAVQCHCSNYHGLFRHCANIDFLRGANLPRRFFGARCAAEIAE